MRRRSLRPIALPLLAGGAWLALAAAGCAGGGGAEGVRATLSASAVLGGGDTVGFARAAAPRTFHFPGDHGPHPGFRNEWWYFTGNLVARGGRRFGYELTFFRTALAARPPARASDWAANEVYMAHFALTDAAAGRFRARERFERPGAMALAGAMAGPGGMHVWVDDWQAASRAYADAGTRGHGDAGTERPTLRDGLSVPRSPKVPSRLEAPGCPVSPCPRVPVSAVWPLTLSARDSGMALQLSLAQGKPPVLQGDHGLSRKGPGAGDASYYYSLTRMPTTGWLEIAGERYAVDGESWLDREWSTSALAKDEVGWDWLALQLSDGRELMLYRIRRRDGTSSPFSAGTLVAADGGARALAAADARVDVAGTWASPRDGTRYPASWRVRVPSAGLDLDVRPIVADQELNLTVRYWEGAVDVTGSAGGRAVAGHGYVELTGYGPQPTTAARAGAGLR